jgi:hypothetical protein
MTFKPAASNGLVSRVATIKPCVMGTRLKGTEPFSVRHVPRVDDVQTSGFKWAGVARCHNQPMCDGRSGDVAICARDSLAFGSCTGSERGVGFRGG